VGLRIIRRQAQCFFELLFRIGVAAGLCVGYGELLADDGIIGAAL
jgi:hypothetical protein